MYGISFCFLKIDVTAAFKGFLRLWPLWALKLIQIFFEVHIVFELDANALMCNVNKHMFCNSKLYFISGLLTSLQNP
jgi:hypothetical protein